jgi:hypothetical protein
MNLFACSSQPWKPSPLPSFTIKTRSTLQSSMWKIKISRAPSSRTGSELRFCVGHSLRPPPPTSATRNRRTVLPRQVQSDPPCQCEDMHASATVPHTQTHRSADTTDSCACKFHRIILRSLSSLCHRDNILLDLPTSRFAGQTPYIYKWCMFLKVFISICPKNFRDHI